MSGRRHDGAKGAAPDGSAPRSKGGSSRRRSRPRAPRPRLTSEDIPRGAQIFVNRNLKMSSVKLIGFDMDHTLAIYRPREFEAVAFDESKKKLVEEKGYPEAVMDFEYDHDFVIRGLVVDKPRGNILKMDRHHYVSRAFHGLTPLPATTRKELYKGKKIPLSLPQYASIDTLFSLPEVSLYAQLVELMESLDPTVDFAQLYDDVRECVDTSHADGSIKSVVKSDPEYYVLPDDNLALTFDKLRRHGKRLFLLTNSEADYTEILMSVLLEGQLGRYPSWKDYFDIIVVSAGKPAFFVSDAPLRHVDGPRAGEPVRPRDPGKMFEGGSAGEFEARSGFHGDQILYFGDHTYGDILRSKSTSGWRTAMILSELEQEIESQDRARRFASKAAHAERWLDRLISDRDLLEIELTAKEKRARDADLPDAEGVRLRDEIRELKRGLKELDRQIGRAERRLERSWQDGEARYNENWGPIFKNGNTQSRFGAQITRFACVYTSRASNFFYYPVNKFFKPHGERMPHELGM